VVSGAISVKPTRKSGGALYDQSSVPEDLVGEPLIHPLMLLALFSTGSGDDRVYPLHKTDFLPETPDRKVWVGGELGLNPEQSTMAWIGRSDQMSKRWPVLLVEANQSKLLTENTLEDWDYWSTESALSRIVGQYLEQMPWAPTMLFVHNICWRDPAYIKVHTKARSEVRRERHGWVPYGEAIAMQFDRAGRTPGLIVRPSELRWRAPSGINPRQIGFVKRKTSSLIVERGEIVSQAYRERLAVGRPRTNECRVYHAAGLPIGADGLCYNFSTERKAGAVLTPFSPGRNGTKSQGAAAILDVQLVKFWRITPTRSQPGPLDVDYEELVLAFERKSGQLVYLGVARGPLLNTIARAEDQDWGLWLRDNKRQAEVAMGRYDSMLNVSPHRNSALQRPADNGLDGMLGGASDDV
jgi:hypothetical protein